VGSGPALADPSSQQEAEELLAQLDGIALPALLGKCRSALIETPKSLDLQAELLADHHTLAKLARQLLGKRARQDPQWKDVVTDDVQVLATDWAHLARRLQSQGFQGTLIATGEPTVQLSPNASGRGGRCQEIAARFAREIAGLEGVALLAGSSDGTDGPTPYAGALVDGQSWGRLETLLGQDRCLALLSRNDTSGLLEALPDLLLDTGPTGHNLNDLFLLSVGQPGLTS
jgi:hydroxypyruvate reductase